MTAGRQERGDTRARILWTAVDLFSTSGYAESGMRELAARVGIKPASLYHHFPSKEALLDEIFDHFLQNDGLYRAREDEIVRGAAGRDVEGILGSLVVFFIADERFYNMNKIVRIALGYQFENRRARDVFQHIYYDVALGSRERALEALVREGVLEPFDCQAVAYALTSYSMMLFMQCAAADLSIDAYTHTYNDGMRRAVRTLAATLRRRT